MGWLHACNTPGDFRIWLTRSTGGRRWQCDTCKTVWALHRRNPTGYYAFWEWRRTTTEAAQ